MSRACVLAASLLLLAASPASAQPFPLDSHQAGDLVDTGVDVRSGDVLVISARGRWWDFFVPTSANGYVYDLAYAFRSPPRVRDKDRYYRLLGRIADADLRPGTPDPPLSDAPDGSFVIGRGVVYTAKRSGRLYLFVNDRCHFYWNNFGSVMVAVALRRPDGALVPLEARPRAIRERGCVEPD